MSHAHTQHPLRLGIVAGQGGREAHAWVKILAHMYHRYAILCGGSLTVVDVEETPDGYRSVLLGSPRLALSLFERETGAHRLSRFSPFGKGGRRQTSFAGVSVWQETPPPAVVTLRPGDLEFSAFRSSGKGGQNVNKVSTAVRLVHRPTGLVVTSQEERTQGRNREIAERKLRDLLRAAATHDWATERAKLCQSAGPAGFGGHRIRSYVFAPDALVKDHRSGRSSVQVERILQGELGIIQ